ncbi:MAG: hypothetical protein IAF08_00920 [Rhizobacter sp.]|nr:hypothetical protein [Chlorobiales bacterium]
MPDRELYVLHTSREHIDIEEKLDYIEGGETVDDFLEGFPTVSREQIVRFLETATSSDSSPM